MDRICSKTLIQDMDLLNSVLPKIDNTITSFGKNKLKQYLETYTINKVSALIDIVEFFNKNTLCRSVIESELHFIKHNEKIIKKWIRYPRNYELEFYMGLKYNLKCISKKLDFDLFNNVVTLTLSNSFRFSTVIIQIIFYFIMWRMYKFIGINMDAEQYIKSIIIGYYTSATFFLSYLIPHKTFVDFLAKLATGLYAIFIVYSCYSSVMDCIKHYKLCEDFKEEYYIIYDVIKSCEKIYVCDNFKHMLWHESDITEFEKSFLTLKSHFGNDRILGEIIVESINYDKFADALLTIIDYISNIDVIISNSKLLNSGYASPHYMSDNSNPTLHGTNLWNPMLDSTNQVKNDVMLGFTENNTMILTGPNKAGKSTYIRTIILAIYLAQSLGVTCAESLYFTPFDNIFTYLNVPDSIGKESLFEAELERCYEYYDKTTNLNKKSIGFIDELFTGTNYLEGMSGSYAIVKKLSECPNIITIVSTHFHEICTIPNVQYCKFYANVKNNKNIKSGESMYDFTYKIKKGISNQCIALNLLKEKGYDDDIINTALNKLKIVNKK